MEKGDRVSAGTRSIEHMIDATLTDGPASVDDLDALGVLAEARASIRLRRAGEARPYVLALRWAGLHPATTDDRALWSDLLGHDAELADEATDRVGGVGSPQVTRACIAELGTALKLSTASAAHLIQDTLDLAFRLPRCWSALVELRADAWRARMVARLTHPLSPEACAWVDAQLAHRLDAVGAVAIKNVVAEAILGFHPDLAAEAVRRGKAGWHVDVHHPDQVDFTSTSDLSARADSLDLEDFAEAVALVAEQLRVDGDDDTLGQRRAKALGEIGRAMTGRPARPAPTEPDRESLDEEFPGQSTDPDPTSDPIHPAHPANQRTSGTDSHPGLGGLDGLAPTAMPRRRKPFRVHVSLSEAATTGTTSTGIAVCHAGKFGLVTQDVLDRWISSHGARATKVIDLSRAGAVDQHDPPAWMRALVIERDRHCVFPRCNVDAVDCDLDHIVAYDPHGPPGQTRPDALACLCRRHHLAKTFDGWSYRRLPDGGYLWTSPHGWRAVVTRDGETWELG